MTKPFEIRCHRCSSWIGEAKDPMELVGIFKVVRDVELIRAPRNTWRCKSCGWANVFRVAEPAGNGKWRDVELKEGAASS